MWYILFRVELVDSAFQEHVYNLIACGTLATEMPTSSSSEQSVLSSKHVPESQEGV